MIQNILHHTDIIHIQSSLLMDSTSSFMTTAQRQAIELINNYAKQLATIVMQENSDNQNLETSRHEIINILTPIVGYVEMLSDEWIGTLNPKQASQVEIIRQSVSALRDIVLKQRLQKAMLESA